MKGLTGEEASVLGHGLRRERRHAGMTQAQLAERAGIDRATISQIENGRVHPRSDTLLRLAKVLGINPSEFWSVRDSVSADSQPTDRPEFRYQPGDANPVDKDDGSGLATPDQDEPERLSDRAFHYEPLETYSLHPGLKELLEDKDLCLLFKISEEEKTMLASIRTHSRKPISKEFFIDVLLAYRRHRGGD